ncbi:3-hydroxyacyl-ACP dehydratase FabZ family protein [Streptacidiphilus anmyonensis]|uniref:3-hydroxyacyl-ACP dehydratase FabZ family protein n=1 Tax=Streptacidiphilus anmyonensis TaxID=405782 RepID=UPI000AC5A001|nr:beta-hydroxyacyl-ACP dehydratase [Streptacidiphilus anmyonensis]
MTTAPVIPAPLSVEMIRVLIPHRYPMLLVDRVLTVSPGAAITTLKAVTCNEPWYRDLPDDAPDADHGYPVALVVESWCQSAALLAAWGRTGGELTDQVALFGGMSDVAVRGTAMPGDVLRHEVRISRALEGAWFFEGRTTVDGVPVLEVGQVMTALRPASVLRPAPPA